MWCCGWCSRWKEFLPFGKVEWVAAGRKWTRLRWGEGRTKAPTRDLPTSQAKLLPIVEDAVTTRKVRVPSTIRFDFRASSRSDGHVRWLNHDFDREDRRLGLPIKCPLHIPIVAFQKLPIVSVIIERHQNLATHSGRYTFFRLGKTNKLRYRSPLIRAVGRHLAQKPILTGGSKEKGYQWRIRRTLRSDRQWRQQQAQKCQLWRRQHGPRTGGKITELAVFHFKWQQDWKVNRVQTCLTACGCLRTTPGRRLLFPTSNSSLSHVDMHVGCHPHSTSTNYRRPTRALYTKIGTTCYISSEHNTSIVLPTEIYKFRLPQYHSLGSIVEVFLGVLSRQTHQRVSFEKVAVQVAKDRQGRGWVQAAQFTGALRQRRC